MRSPRVSPILPFIAVAMLAGLLNFYQIDRTSLWNDEAFSFFAADSGPAHALRFIASDTQPPLYYLTLSLWLGLGTSVLFIRGLSAAAMTLALLPLYGSARRLFGDRVALLASLLFAIAPLDISWAQKARPYPLQVLLVACAFWGFLRAWGAGDRVIGAGLREALRQRSLTLASVDLGWLAYAVFGALAMLAQAPAGFFLLGCNVAVALGIGLDFSRNRVWLLNWVIAQLLLVLIWLPWLPAFLSQVAAHLTPEQIASKHSIFLVGIGQVLGTLQGLFGIAGLWRLGSVFLPVYIALAGFAVVQIARRQPAAWILPAVIVVPVAACLAGFFLLHPIFGYVINTFIWILVPYTILIAFGIASIRPRWSRLGVFALVVAGNVWGIKNVYQTDTPPLDRVAEVIRANKAADDGIVLSEAASGRWGIAYYLGPPFGTLVGLPVTDWDAAGLIHSAADTKGLRRVWLVLVDGETPAVDIATARPGMKRVFEQRVGSFQIERFE